MPNPNPGESKKDYLKRCIPELIKQENRPQKQSIAICMNMFDRHVSKSGQVSLENTQYLLKNFNSDLIQEDLVTKIKNKATNLKNKVTGIKNIATGLMNSDVYDLSVGVNQLSDTKKSETLPELAVKHHINQTLISKLKKPSTAKLTKFDDRSINNKINTKPEGIIITDTINNPIFPIDQPIIDNAKFNLPDIKLRYQAYYSSLPVNFLPWHYTIEMINGKYYYFNTRPIDMKFPVNNIEFKELLEVNQHLLPLTESTRRFINNQPFDLSNAIHVCIVGDTNLDVYIEELYEMIGRICVEPILAYFKLPKSINLRVINFNLGKKFIFEKLDNYIKR